MGTAADSVEAVFREEWGRLLATLVRTLGDLDLAEEVAADAVATALQRWPRDGVPDRPAAWLLTTARHRAVDLLRRDRVLAAKLTLLRVEADRHEPPPPEPDPGWAGPGWADPGWADPGWADPGWADPDDEPDERLFLFFTCCHPALALEAQTALTLNCL